MPGFVFHTGATATCPHGGGIQTIPSSPRVTVSGQPVATLASQSIVAGCASFASPCVRVQWLTGATRVRVNGVAVLLGDSSGICSGANGTPQGGPTILATQPRVQGT